MEIFTTLPREVQITLGVLAFLALIFLVLWLKARSEVRRQSEAGSAAEAQLRGQLDIAQGKSKQLADQLSKTQRELEEERKHYGDLNALQARYGEVSSALDANTQTLSTRQQEIARADKELAARRSELQALQAKHEDASRTLNELIRTVNERDRERGDLERRLAELRQHLADTEHQLSETQHKMATLEAQIANRRPIAESIGQLEARLRAVTEQQLGQLRGASETILHEAQQLRQQLDSIPTGQHASSSQPASGKQSASHAQQGSAQQAAS